MQILSPTKRETTIGGNSTPPRTLCIRLQGGRIQPAKQFRRDTDSKNICKQELCHAQFSSREVARE